MPQRGRSRRAAARQTQLGQRKKKQPRSASENAAAPPPTQVRETGDGSVAVPAAPVEAARLQPTPAPRPLHGRQAEARRTVYQYAGPEIKRILSLSTVILVIIIVLSFVLR